MNKALSISRVLTCFVLIVSIAFIIPDVSASEEYHNVNLSLIGHADTAMIKGFHTFSTGYGNDEQHWRKTFDGRKPDFLFSVQQTTDNGYIATGHTSQSWFDSGLWLIKIDSDDNTYTKQTATDKDISIDGEIKCPTKPFIKGHKEKFYVTLNNKGNDEIAAMVEFHLWDHKDKEWKFFGESRCTIPPSHIKDTDADDISITWPGCWFQEPWGPQEPWSPLWPGRFRPREIRAELYVGDVLVDTQESRYFMGFFIF